MRTRVEKLAELRGIGQRECVSSSRKREHQLGVGHYQIGFTGIPGCCYI
jgi:hypothetical protein